MANRVDLIKGLIMQNEIKITFKKEAIRNKRQSFWYRLRKYLMMYWKKMMTTFFGRDIIRLMSSPAANSYISSNFFPQDLSEYGRYRNIIEYTNDLRLELRWMIYCLHFYSKELSTFVKRKRKVWWFHFVESIWRSIKSCRRYRKNLLALHCGV